MRKSLACWVVMSAIHTGCVRGLPENHPNLAGCNNASGTPYAAPMVLRTDCWSGQDANVVLWGNTPGDGKGPEAFLLEAQDPLPAKIQGDLASEAALGLDDQNLYLCTMHVNVEALGLTCEGTVDNGWQIPCSKPGEPSHCAMQFEQQEAWKPLRPSYIDTHKKPM